MPGEASLGGNFYPTLLVPSDSESWKGTMTGEYDREGYTECKATPKQRQLSGEIGLSRRLIDKREQIICVLHEVLMCPEEV